jgi:SAM-dependent methyltransferase
MPTPTTTWTDAAGAWDRNRRHVEVMKAPLTSSLLAGLDLRPGQRVLELGAGTGELARRLAAGVRPGGRVIASDLAPDMVELIGRTTAGEDGIDVRRLDATAIDLPDASVDAVVFRMGLMLVPDPALVTRECRRVLVAGGRLAVAVWASPAQNLWLASVGLAAAQHGLVDGPPTGPGGPFSLAEPAALDAVLRAGGFDQVTVTEIDTPATFADAHEHLDTVLGLAAPLAAVLAAAPAETRAAVRATAAELAAGFATAGETDGHLVLSGQALLAVAH